MTFDEMMEAGEVRFVKSPVKEAEIVIPDAVDPMSVLRPIPRDGITYGRVMHPQRHTWHLGLPNPQPRRSQMLLPAAPIHEVIVVDDEGVAQRMRMGVDGHLGAVED